MPDPIFDHGHLLTLIDEGHPGGTVYADGHPAGFLPPEKFPYIATGMFGTLSLPLATFKALSWATRAKLVATYANQPGALTLGFWIDGNRIDFDLGLLYSNLDVAIDTANHYNQYAIYDRLNNEVIPTNPTF